MLNDRIYLPTIIFGLFLIIVFVLGLTIQPLIRSLCEKKSHGYVSQNDSTQINPGLTLISPYVGNAWYDNLGEVDLVDTNGRIVHRWMTKYPVLYAILKLNGNLLVAMTPPSDISSYPGGGKTGIIQEFDREGNVIWEYQDEYMHHDFELLPNDDIAYLKWEKAPEEFAAHTKGGFSDSNGNSVWLDAIVVVNRDKKIVWTWHMYEHLVPLQYTLNTFTPKSEWSHSNSIRYTQDNPITHTPAYLLSARHINRVLMIEADSGRVLWQTLPDLVAFQHDATFTPTNTVLIFDNGFFRKQSRPFLWSRVVEVDPRTDAVVWEYHGGESGAEKAQIASSIMGGAQRLENGNTLITLSTQNKIIEVTPDKKIVWKYTYDATTPDGRSPIIFKVRKYGRSYAPIQVGNFGTIICSLL